MSSVINTADQVKAWVEVFKKAEDFEHEFKDFERTLAWREGIYKRCFSATSDDLYREDGSSKFLFEALASADFVLMGKGSTVEIDAARKKADHLCGLMVADRAVRDCFRA